MAGRTITEPPEAGEPRPGPDAGLAAISAGFAAGVGMPGRRPRPRDENGDGITPRVPRLGPQDIWPLRVSPQSSTAATNFDPVDWGPPTGRAWRIEEVIVTFAGASAVTIYKEAVAAVNLRFQFTVSGVWEPKNMILLPAERLVAAGTGGGFIIAIEGSQMSLDILPDHLL